MKASKIINLKNLQIGLLLVLFVGLNSCGTYQGAYNGDDDGIYASNNQTRNEVVIVENQSNFDQNYFSKQLEDLQNLKQEDTFTDIDDYYYDDNTVQDDQLYTNYNEPWGYDGDVVININSGYGYMSPNYYWYNPFYEPYYNYYPYYYNPWRFNYYNPYYSYGYNPYRYEYYGYYGNYYNPYNSYYNYPYYYGRNYDSYGKRTNNNTSRRGYENASLSNTRRSGVETNSSRRNINTNTRRAGDGNLNRSNNTNRNNSIEGQSTRSNNTIQRGSNNNTIQRSSSTRRNSSYNFSPANLNRATSVNPNRTSIIRVNPYNSANQNSTATPNNVRRENNTNTVRRESNTNYNSTNTGSSRNENSSVSRSSNTESRSSSTQSSSSNSSSRSNSRRD